MSKNLKLKITNTQLAKAAGLDKLKEKLSGKTEKDKEKEKKRKAKPPVESEEQKAPRVRAKSKSSFAPEAQQEVPVTEKEATSVELKSSETQHEEVLVEEKKEEALSAERLGPTGKHINDLLTTKKTPAQTPPLSTPKGAVMEEKISAQTTSTPPKVVASSPSAAVEEEKKESKKGKAVRDLKDLKPLKKQQVKSFDARDRQGLTEEDERWRKKRPIKGFQKVETKEEKVVRPTAIKVRVPISIKDLAVALKLKSSEVIQKLFLQGMIYTLNDTLDDETVIQYIGNEFGTEITIDKTEEKRIQITSQNIKEEIATTPQEALTIRPPVVTFMGHVDHGKTSLIDAIRKSNRVAGEAGAITQHIGAFKCQTAVGDITILDTPGHEAFSAMRARGAEVTDIVVLVVAGDEGMKEQTHEALQHAKAAGVTIVVAINKADKPGFNAENVYRELSEVELLPEAWGGQTITINTSAATGAGISEMLEMLALQAEVLELKANNRIRARGTVLESELHKGLGAVTTILVQNGTLHVGDAIVFDQHWGRVKTMHDEHGKLLEEATPSSPVAITGLSGLPAAGDPFIVVKNEKEAREIIEARIAGKEHKALYQKKVSSLEKLLQQEGTKKILKLLVRADVQGSVEALKTSIMKIESSKVQVEIIFSGVGEISESDIQLAAASHAAIIGFHTKIESHSESLIKELGVTVHLFDIIYHAIEDIKLLMKGMLDKIEQEKEMGEAIVQAVFKASQLGQIAGCLVTEGVIGRNHRLRVVREGAVIWKGGIASLKRVKEDVKEVKKGLECGILLDGFSAIQVGDKLQAYELIYLTQEI